MQMMMFEVLLFDVPAVDGTFACVCCSNTAAMLQATWVAPARRQLALLNAL